MDLSLAELSEIADAELSAEEEARLLGGQGGLFSLPFSGSSLDVLDGLSVRQLAYGELVWDG